MPADQLSSITGVTVTEVAGPTPQSRGLSCTFEYPLGGGQSGTGEIHFTTWLGKEFYTPDTVEGYGTALSGVGDAATVSENAGRLIFRSGEYVVQIQIFGPEVDSVVEIGRAAAEHIR